MYELFLVSAARYADVSLEYGTHGRVYIRHYQYGYNTYEVCSNGFSNTDGEAICRSRGLSYSSYTTYVICNHSMFELNLKCLIPMYCTLKDTFFQYFTKQQFHHSGHKLQFIQHLFL